MISFNITYFNEPHMLKWWYDTINRLNAGGLSIKVNIADDCSRSRPASDFFEKHQPTEAFSLFRVRDDLGFNSHGCRNLLIQQTETDWNVLTDIDLIMADDVIEDVVNAKKRRGQYYNFWDTRDKITRLNTFVVHREDFKLSGGYDEELVDLHFGDRLFFQTSLDPVCQRVDMFEWWCHSNRIKRNVVYADVRTMEYPDDLTMVVPINYKWADANYRESVIDFLYKRNSDPVKRMNKPTINFEWEQVF